MARKKRKNPLLAVAYIRTSPHRGGVDRDSQHAAIKKWADHREITIVKVCEDLGALASAAIARRPALTEAFEGLHAHNAGVLVVADLGRLAMNNALKREIEREVHRQGATIISTAGELSGNGTPPHKLRDETGRYADAPKCDGCGQPCAKSIDPENPDAGNYFTDDEVCGSSDGPGFLLCARRRCIAKRDKLNVEQRRELYTAQRASHSTD